MKKIDIHVHSRIRKGIPSLGGLVFPTPDELRHVYDMLGIEKGVNLPSGMSGCEFQHDIITNEEACELSLRYPDTYYWFCGVDPRWGKNSPDADLSHFINYNKALGAKGVGELVANLNFDEPRMLNLFYHCEKCDMPVIFHIGNPTNDYGVVDDLGLPRLEKVLNLFPKLIFLGHSQKFWSEISGDCSEELRNGYPEGPVVPGGRVVELMRNYTNLHADLSAGSGFNAVSRDPEFGYAFIEEFQDRLYFGTDFCDARRINDPRRYLSHWLDEAFENGYISKNAYEKVCRLNALKLLER